MFFKILAMKRIMFFLFVLMLITSIVVAQAPKSFNYQAVIRDDANELVASNNMKQLVDELGTRYRDRVVIFDSPPLLSSNDAVVLSNMMGQIVLIIESGKTEQSAVKEAVERLDGNKNISVILNKKIGGAGSGYGYHGYYGS